MIMNIIFLGGEMILVNEKCWKGGGNNSGLFEEYSNYEYRDEAQIYGKISECRG